MYIIVQSEIALLDSSKSTTGMYPMTWNDYKTRHGTYDNIDVASQLLATLVHPCENVMGIFFSESNLAGFR